MECVDKNKKIANVNERENERKREEKEEKMLQRHF